MHPEPRNLEAIHGYNESFNGKLRDELLNGEIFYSMKEATILIERWRRHYNTVRPHRSYNRIWCLEEFEVWGVPC